MTDSSGSDNNNPNNSDNMNFHPSKRGRKRRMEEAGGDDKMLERLQKNRESARESRKRKKAQMEKIESRLHELEEENRILLLELKKGKEHVILEEEEKWTITKQLGEV